jgi:hypothetical protein
MEDGWGFSHVDLNTLNGVFGVSCLDMRMPFDDWLHKAATVMMLVWRVCVLCGCLMTGR